MLNLYAPINDRSYGIVSANICNSLVEQHEQVNLFPVGGRIDLSFNQKLKQNVAQCLNFNTINAFAPCLKIWHQFELQPFIGHGEHIAWTIFELDSFNQNERKHIESVDKLIVCSEWAKSVVLNNTNLSPNNIFVISLGVDSSIYYPTNTSNINPYIFLNIGKTEIRKGHAVLIDAFCKAFNPSDNVELWVSWTNPFLNQQEASEWNNYYLHSSLGNKIKFIPWYQTQTELAKCINMCHCFISPSFAEGFNLPVLEAMACGKPVITTNYSGHTQFCNKHNSFLVEPTELENAYDGKWFFGQGKWMKFGEEQLDQLVQHMRNCYKNKIIDNKEGLKTAQSLSWSNSTKLLKQIYLPKNIVQLSGNLKPIRKIYART